MNGWPLLEITVLVLQTGRRMLRAELAHERHNSPHRLRSAVKQSMLRIQILAALLALRAALAKRTPGFMTPVVRRVYTWVAVVVLVTMTSTLGTSRQLTLAECSLTLCHPG